jgi:hypothetical protein
MTDCKEDTELNKTKKTTTMRLSFTKNLNMKGLHKTGIEMF